MIAATLRRRVRTGALGRSPARAGDDRVTQEQATLRRVAMPAGGTSRTRQPHLLSLRLRLYQRMHAALGARRARATRRGCASVVLRAGYDEATVAVIADRAGLTKTTFPPGIP